MIKNPKFLFLLIVLTSSLRANCQKLDSTSSYRNLVFNFYELIYEKKFASIQECINIFGSAAYELEEYLQIQNCGKVSSDSCIKIVRDRFQRISSSRSILLTELAKHKNRFGPSYDYCISAISNPISTSDNMMKFNFPNGTLVFAFTNPKYDELCITDVFLMDGSSIFNFIDGIEKNYLKP